MKKISLIIVAAFICHITIAQKYLPKISDNAVINYNVFATAVGQQIQLKLTIVSVIDPVVMKWDIPGLGTGSYQLSAKGFESGTKMRLKEPEDGVTKLKDDETIMLISKSAFSDLVKTQSFTLNNTKFTVKAVDTAPYKINDKEADVIHALSANGKVDIWILNDPDFPLICKLSGSPQGIDVDMLNITE